jgi:hypothetical protein
LALSEALCQRPRCDPTPRHGRNNGRTQSVAISRFVAVLSSFTKLGAKFENSRAAPKFSASLIARREMPRPSCVGAQLWALACAFFFLPDRGFSERESGHPTTTPRHTSTIQGVDCRIEAHGWASFMAATGARGLNEAMRSLSISGASGRLAPTGLVTGSSYCQSSRALFRRVSLLLGIICFNCGVEGSNCGLWCSILYNRRLSDDPWRPKPP